MASFAPDTQAVGGALNRSFRALKEVFPGSEATWPTAPDIAAPSMPMIAHLRLGSSSSPFGYEVSSVDQVALTVSPVYWTVSDLSRLSR